MKRIMFLVPALLVMALASGCVVSGTTRVHGRAHVHSQPAMVYVSPGVYVIEDYHEPVFYSDGYYWRYYGNVWYRSSYHTGGWVVYRNVPRHVRSIDRPHTYVRYRANNRGGGNVRVKDRDHRGNGTVHTRQRDNSGGSVRTRDHRGQGSNNNGRGTGGVKTRDTRGSGSPGTTTGGGVKTRDTRGSGSAGSSSGSVKTRDHRGQGTNNNGRGTSKPSSGGVKKRDHRK